MRNGFYQKDVPRLLAFANPLNLEKEFRSRFNYKRPGETTVIIVSNAAWGPFMSGGDNIFIECARRWSVSGKKIIVCVWEEGFAMCQRQALKGVKYVIWPANNFRRYGFFVLYVARILVGSWHAARMPLLDADVLYSSSDFWPDLLPAFIIKLRRRSVIWVAGFYLFAPSPWDKTSPYKGAQFIKGVLYWLTQQPAIWIVRRFADRVFVTSDPDVERFVTTRLPREHVVVVRGGVDISLSQSYLLSGNPLDLERKSYDACFVGRFHEQKGVLELIEIWRMVVAKRPQARLAMIGDGPLMSSVRDRIKAAHLESRIDLLGYKSGDDKFTVFKQSRLVVHPAVYDSGGMAAAEAMAWGLPGVSFDLEALRTYYPKGVLKTACFDFKAFADNILRIITDAGLYRSLSEEAADLIRSEWSWDSRVKSISEAIWRKST